MTYKIHSPLNQSELSDTRLHTPTATPEVLLTKKSEEALKYLKHLVEVVFKAAGIKLPL